MRNLINKPVQKDIYIENLVGKEIVAYKCKSTNSKHDYAILAKLNVEGAPSFDFVPIGYSDSHPRFVSNSWKGSIELASKVRDLKIFLDAKELIESMYEKLF